MSTVRPIIAALLAAASLVVVTATTDAAHAVAEPSKKITVSNVRPIAKEEVAIYGHTYGGVARPVKLQYRTKHAWKTVKTKTSEADGFFTFFVFPTTTRSYRYYSPKVTIAGTTHAAVKGTSRRVTVVKQRVVGLVAHNTRQCSAYAPELITLLVDFYPARPGREVQVVIDGSVVTAHQDVQGVAKLEFYPSLSVGTHTTKPKAQPHNGAAAFSTAPVTYSWSNAYCA